jgi:1-deoxy-D-xylulose-5-phosphate reductoisomerase
VAVEAFRGGGLRFVHIVDTVERVLDEHVRDGLRKLGSIADVLEVESWARTRAAQVVETSEGSL